MKAAAAGYEWRTGGRLGWGSGVQSCFLWTRDLLSRLGVYQNPSSQPRKNEHISGGEGRNSSGIKRHLLLGLLLRLLGQQGILLRPEKAEGSEDSGCSIGLVGSGPSSLRSLHSPRPEC